MAEYIERESVIKQLNSLKERACRQGDSDDEGTLMIVRNAIGDLPSIDIVRCSDCKDCYENYCLVMEMEVREDGGCSYGEKKDETD